MGRKRDFSPLRKHIGELKIKGYSVQDICDYICTEFQEDIKSTVYSRRGKKKLKKYINNT